MNMLLPALRGWDGEFETEEGWFAIFVPETTLRRRYQEELERLGIPTDDPQELMQQARRLVDRQFLVRRQLQEIDYWRTHTDPSVRIRPHQYLRKPMTPYS